MVGDGAVVGETAGEVVKQCLLHGFFEKVVIVVVWFVRIFPNRLESHVKDNANAAISTGYFSGDGGVDVLASMLDEAFLEVEAGESREEGENMRDKSRRRNGERCKFSGGKTSEFIEKEVGVCGKRKLERYEWEIKRV